MKYFLKVEETTDNLAPVQVAYTDIEENQQFKTADLTEVDTFQAPSEEGKWYKPYFNKTTCAVEWTEVSAG